MGTRSNGTFVVAADTRHHAYEKRLQLHREQIFAKKLKHSSNSDDARAKGENGEYTDSSFLYPNRKIRINSSRQSIMTTKTETMNLLRCRPHQTADATDAPEEITCKTSTKWIISSPRDA